MPATLQANTNISTQTIPQKRTNQNLNTSEAKRQAKQETRGASLRQTLARLTNGGYQGTIVISFNLHDTIINYSEARQQSFAYIAAQMGKPEAKSLSLMGEDGKNYSEAENKFKQFGIIPSLISDNIDILKQYKAKGTKLVLVTAEESQTVSQIMDAYDVANLPKLIESNQSADKDIAKINVELSQFDNHITTRNTFKEKAKLEADINALQFKQTSDKKRLDILKTGSLKDSSLREIFDAIQSPENYKDLSDFLISDYFGKVESSLLTGKTKPALPVYFALLNQLDLKPTDDINFIHIGDLSGTDLQFVENISRYNKDNDLAAKAIAVFAGKKEASHKEKYPNADIRYFNK